MDLQVQVVPATATDYTHSRKHGEHHVQEHVRGDQVRALRNMGSVSPPGG